MTDQNNTAKIGVSTATIVGVNAMIGAGIFTAPAIAAGQIGPAAIVTYLFITFAVLFMALSLGRLAYLFPEEGSFYIYAKQWGGHGVGLIAAGAYMIGLLIAMGLLAQMAGTYLHTLFPSVDTKTLGGITLGSLVVLNIFGMKMSQLGQRILIVSTVFPLLTTIIMCLTKANTANLTPFAPYGWDNMFKATHTVIFGFFGFEASASLFNIIEKPEKNLPRALSYSIFIVGMLYTLYVTSLILSTPLAYIADPNVPISEGLRNVFPHQQWILTAIHVSTLSAILGTVHSMIWSSSMLLASLARTIMNTGKKSTASGWSHTISVLTVGGCIFSSFFLLKNMGLFFSFTAIFLMIALLLSMITLLVDKKEWQSGHNIKTIIGFATCCLILYFAVSDLVRELTHLG